MLKPKDIAIFKDPVLTKGDKPILVGFKYSGLYELSAHYTIDKVTLDNVSNPREAELEIYEMLREGIINNLYGEIKNSIFELSDIALANAKDSDEIRTINNIKNDLISTLDL